MIKTHSSQSGIFTLRVLFAFSLCSVGMLLALFSLSAKPTIQPASTMEGDSAGAAGRGGTMDTTRAIRPRGRVTRGGPRKNPRIAATGTWSIVPSANENHGLQSNGLGSVVCNSASDCWAVGNHIEHWDGAAWSIVDDDLGDSRRGFSNVTCTSDSNCWAVGYHVDPADNYQTKTLIEHWDGASWTIMPSPNANLNENQLTGVVCNSAADCWAVGYYDEVGDEYSYRTLVEHWNGTSWSIVFSPGPKSSVASKLYAVQCTSISDCWAAGTYAYVDGSAWHGAPLIQHWNGTAWSVVSVATAGIDDKLYDLTCPSSSDCWAVGSTDYGKGSATHPLIFHWDGAAWSFVSAAEPEGTSSLAGVTCVSGSSCWAVGWGPWANHTLVEHWDGNSWSIVASPNGVIDGKPAEWDALVDVVCTGASNCWAVGYYGNSVDHGTFYLPLGRTFIQQWNGKSWQAVESPNIDHAITPNFLYDITCTSGSDCWTVGNYTYAYDKFDVPLYQPVIEHWNGNQWTLVPSPRNTGDNDASLTGISCLSSSDCWAVGYSGNTAVTEHWDGASWTIVDSPSIGAGYNTLDRVTCLSSSDCWAVGWYYDVPSGFEKTLVSHWDGNSWSIVTSPDVANSRHNGLFAIHCSSGSDCWAAGRYVTNGNVAQTLIEHWNGTSWSIVASPNTGPTNANLLFGVTCSLANDCWSVGRHVAGGVSQTLVEHWDGGSWQIVASPNTSPLQLNRLRDVRCESGSRCWAVGYYYLSGNGALQTLIEKWDGVSWSIVPSPNVSVYDDSLLYGLSCSLGSGCWSAGYHADNDYYDREQTLIEHLVPAAPTLTSAVSRKVHGTVGPFDINLPQTGNPGIECRFGGSTGNYQMVFTFGTDLVSVGNISTSAGSVSSSSIGPNPNQYVVNLTGIPNAQYLTVTLNSVQDLSGGIGNVSATMGVLIGDSSGNGIINSTDLSQTKARIGQPITTNTFRSDIQSNGSVNAADISLVKLNMGSSLP